MKSAVYRLGQFVHYWRNAPLNPAAQTQVDSILPTPELGALFRQMSPGEQRHSLNVLARLEAGRPAAPPELQQAALLHDVGKTRVALNVVERGLGVLGQKLFPGAWERWGQGQPRGWRRAFVVARHHAEWGAELAVQAGATARVANLIRRHQTPVTTVSTLEDEWLKYLQAADDAS